MSLKGSPSVSKLLSTMDYDQRLPTMAFSMASPPAEAAAGPLPLRQALLAPAEAFPHVRVVRDYAVLRRIGRLRHAQYVESQRKKYASVVLDRHCLIEATDFTATNIYARDAEGITCAMRIGEVDDAKNPYADFFRGTASRLGLALDRSLTCTRLVRRPNHSGRHAVDLIRFVHAQTVRAGWRYCVMQTAEKLVPFFLKFDFYETGIWSDDPAAGRLQVLVLDTKGRPAPGNGGKNARLQSQGSKRSA
jgi:hypothetical protein